MSDALGDRMKRRVISNGVISGWNVDLNPPIFTADREYLQCRIPQIRNLVVKVEKPLAILQ